jgi:transposase
MPKNRFVPATIRRAVREAHLQHVPIKDIALQFRVSKTWVYDFLHDVDKRGREALNNPRKRKPRRTWRTLLNDLRRLFVAQYYRLFSRSTLAEVAEEWQSCGLGPGGQTEIFRDCKKLKLTYKKVERRAIERLQPHVQLHRRAFEARLKHDHRTRGKVMDDYFFFDESSLKVCLPSFRSSPHQPRH